MTSFNLRILSGYWSTNFSIPFRSTQNDHRFNFHVTKTLFFCAQVYLQDVNGPKRQKLYSHFNSVFNLRNETFPYVRPPGCVSSVGHFPILWTWLITLLPANLKNYTDV